MEPGAQSNNIRARRSEQITQSKKFFEEGAQSKKLRARSKEQGGQKKKVDRARISEQAG